MRRLRSLPLAALGAVLTVTLTACSSTSTSSGGSPTGTSSAAADAGANPAHSSDVPAVQHATEVKVEPVIGAGTPPPPTKLVTQDLVVGKGATAKASDTVVVQYVGANYADGKNFDASWQDNGPATFPLSGVVPGFAQGIEGMKVGGRREIVIPPALGYGQAGSPPAVQPNETLVFVVDLLSIK
jgi:peptidylprolyl isomerase